MKNVPYKVRQKIKKYSSRGLLALNENELFEKIAQACQVEPAHLYIQQMIERPFSLILNIKANHSSSGSFFVKIYKIKDLQKQRQNLEKEFAISRFWFLKFKPFPEFQVIEPIWKDTENLILITRKSAGKNLLKLTNRLRLFPSRSILVKINRFLFAAGQWLAKFQSFSIQEPVPYVNKSIQLSFAYLKDYLSLRLERMVANPKLEFDSRLSQKVLTFIEKQWLLAGQEKDKLCFTHTDFSLSNILVTEGKVTVLDFNKCEINSPYKDLARFCHQLYLLQFKPSYQNWVIKEMQRSFLKGYGDEKADQQPLFKIFFIIHQVTHLGKIARYWEHDFIENFYNRYLAEQVLKDLKWTVSQ